MNSNGKGTNNQLRFSIAILLIAVFVPILAVAGEREKHNPYTVLGLQIRSHLLPETPGARGEDIGPLVFQEIIPCRFVSTLEKDAYANPWGGREFQMMESRTYYPKGILVASNGWENPCSEHVPSDSVGVALRLMSYEAPGAGSVYLAPASTLRTNNIPAMWFAGGQNEMREATVVLRNQGFSLMVDQTTHLTIDIIGYFQKDPDGYGAQGDKGDKGDPGVAGAQGLQGPKGDKGDPGEAGAQGLQGIQGIQGLEGAKGDKGDQGVAGAQGLQGSKGDKGDKGDQGVAGAQGLQGSKGDKGDKGDIGPAGAKGATGEVGPAGPKGSTGSTGAAGAAGPKGDKGDIGPAGAKGATGEVGPAGPKGSTGSTGAAGAAGPKGDKGDLGPAGPKGSTGSTGPKGDKGEKGDRGPKGDPGECDCHHDHDDDGDCDLRSDGADFRSQIGFAGTKSPKAAISVSAAAQTIPVGGSITIADAAVSANSVILVISTDGLNAPIVVTVQQDGSFTAAGSPDRSFKYVVFNVR